MSIMTRSKFIYVAQLNRRNERTKGMTTDIVKTTYVKTWIFTYDEMIKQIVIMRLVINDILFDLLMSCSGNCQINFFHLLKVKLCFSISNLLKVKLLPSATQVNDDVSQTFVFCDFSYFSFGSSFLIGAYLPLLQVFLCHLSQDVG